MRVKLLTLICLLLITTSSIFAQKVITGLVVDDKGQSLPGVTVLAKGTNVATITDLDGKYSISVPDVVTTLEFSMLGLKTVEVAITSNVVNATMEAADQELGDVIVIGYGTQKKSDKTGAVSQIGNDDFDKGVLTDPIQSLQGKVSGVVITKRGGDPNSGFSVKIRGSAGLVSGTDPLYVVDGVPGVDPTTIAPEDIESFNVLKDASSTAIYGSRGANGVIIITTKRGSANLSNFEISSYVSFDQVASRLDLLTAQELRDYVASDSTINFIDNGANTDWQDAIFRTGMSQSHNLAYSGGDGKTSYRASITHTDFKGVLLGTQKTRDIARMNLQHTALNDHLVISANLAGTLEDNEYVEYGGWGTNSVLYQTFQRNPTDPIYNEDGSYFETSRDFNYYNPVALIEQIQNERRAKRFLGNLRADLTIVKGLVLGFNLGYTRNDENSYYFEPSFVRNGTSEGFGKISNANNESKVIETTLGYTNSFGKSFLNVIAGYSFQEDVYWGDWQQGKDPLSDYIGLNNMAVFNKVTVGDIGSYKGSNRLISFFGRAVYNFDSRYYITATVRRDGSSKFGVNNEWGLFPSASLAWSIKRDLLKDVEFISDLKLRFGYGLAGNQEIGNYLDVITYGPAGTAPNPETGEDAINFEASHNANPDLKWEENKELNVGLDYAFAKNRFVGSFEYYQKTTYDLLAEYSVPVPPNASSRTYANVGTIKNTGFEFNLQAYLVDVKNFEWKMIYTFSKNKQEVVSLSNDNFEWEPMKVGWLGGRGLVGEENWTQIVAPGYELGTFYMPEYAGINEEGKFLFYLPNGGVTTNVADAERRIVGHALPKFTMGISNYFVLFNNIDFSFSGRLIYGYDVLNVTRLMYGNPTWLPTENVLASALDDKAAGLNSSPIISSYYLEDGSFFRFDNITLGYTLSTKNSAWIKKIRCYFTSNNVFTITNYTGIDPEINFSGLSFGLDQYDVYPKTRSFTLGLNFIF